MVLNINNDYIFLIGMGLLLGLANVYLLVKMIDSGISSLSNLKTNSKEYKKGIFYQVAIRLFFVVLNVVAIGYLAFLVYK